MPNEPKTPYRTFELKELGPQDGPMVVTVNTYKGEDQVTLRETWRPTDNELAFTKKGVNIPIGFVPEVIQAMLECLQFATGEEWIFTKIEK